MPTSTPRPPLRPRPRPGGALRPLDVRANPQIAAILAAWPGVGGGSS